LSGTLPFSRGKNKGRGVKEKTKGKRFWVRYKSNLYQKAKKLRFCAFDLKKSNSTNIDKNAKR